MPVSGVMSDLCGAERLADRSTFVGHHRWNCGAAHAGPPGDIARPKSASPVSSRSRHACATRCRTASLRRPAHPGPRNGRRQTRHDVYFSGMGHRAETGPISYWHDSLVDGDDLTPRARCPATTMSTSRSSAPASPGSGRRTRCCGSTRRCGSSCWNGRPPGSAPRDATAAGASATTADPPVRSRSATASGSVEADVPRDASSRRRGRRGRGRRRDRLRLAQGRRHRTSPPTGRAAPASATTTRTTRSTASAMPAQLLDADEAAAIVHVPGILGANCHAACGDGAPGAARPAG